MIQPSESPYNSPLWIILKKPGPDGKEKYRLVIDYRKLNEKPISDAYPLPNITEILEQVGVAKFFSVIDLASGFHQIVMEPKDRQKTTFSTPYGHYEYVCMPFGLNNAPPTFQRLMDHVLLGMQGTELFNYLNDIIIYAKTHEEHEDKVPRIYERLSKAGLCLQIDKCEFLTPEVTYLGHKIGSYGVRPDPGKVTAVANFPVPKNVTKFGNSWASLATTDVLYSISQAKHVHTILAHKGRSFKWTYEEQESFQILKDALCDSPILVCADLNKPFVLTTDASNETIGAVLTRGDRSVRVMDLAEIVTN